MFSHPIGLLLLLFATTSLSSASNQYFDVRCDFGISSYPTNTMALVNGSLTSNFSNARNCHVKYKMESAVVRVAVEGFKLSELYSLALENQTVLFLGVANSCDLADDKKYRFHACPKAHTQQQTDLDFLFFGSPKKESISVTIELDNSVLKPGKEANLSVRSDGVPEVKAFEITDDDKHPSLLQITASSDSDDEGMECVLMVSQNCSSMQSNGLAQKDADGTQSSLKLTFTKFGRITLSLYSKPMITSGRWFIGIRCKSNEKKLKNVNVIVTKGYKYDMLGKTLPTVYMCLIAVFGGILIAGFAHFFLNPDFDECSFPFHLEVSPAGNRVPSQEILYYIPEPLPKCTFPFKPWLNVIFVSWFGQGIKTYSYLTAVLAISFMVGAAQFVIARWSNMIEEGDRDLCYYNERCYRPIAIADMPSNFMLSNVPYVIHGIFLALSFSLREAIKQEEGQNGNRYSLENARRSRFAPYDYSVAYALSWALVFEGLFSATYHLCPSRLTFQFDSAFMFIISGLVVVALFNSRIRSIYVTEPEKRIMKHPSETTVQAPKYFLFFVAPLLVFNYIGSIKDTRDDVPIFFEVIYWIALVLWLIIMYIWTLRKVGVSCQWKEHSCGPEEDWRKTKFLIKWLWIVIFPLCLLIIGVTQKDDWSQFFLFSCVAAVALAILGLMSFDTALMFERYLHSGGNCWNGIKQLCQPKQISAALLRNWHRALYVTVTFLFWVFAMYFFKLKATTRKTEKPSVSRTFNKECILWDFFDHHDLWHMLSSFALFMSAYLLIYVTRKIEIYFWVETKYWDDKNNRDSLSQLENGQTLGSESSLRGKPRECEMVIEKRPFDNDILRCTNVGHYACVSYV